MMEKKKINTVLFDFDGTLMNTNEVIINSWQHTFKTLTGKEGNQDVIIKTFGEPLKLTMKTFFPNVDVEEAVEIYRSYHIKNFGEMISLFEGSKEILQELKEKGYKIALVTSRLKGTTMEGLEHYGIKDYFHKIITIEDTTKHKPDPEPIEVALKALGSKADEAIMVGDTKFDIECAYNAKVTSVLVSWALSMGKEDLENLVECHRPDYVIDDFKELHQILAKAKS